KTVSVADIAGASAASHLESLGRDSYQTTRDSIIATRSTLSGEDRRAADALLRLSFDPSSFTLTSMDGAPAVQFAVPGSGRGAEGDVVQLDPLKLDAEPAWWREVRRSLPVTDDEGTDRWTTPAYRVIARYDTSGEVAHLSLADTSRREWPIGPMSGPVHRIDWLDRPAIGDTDRRALVRAFNAAAAYDETARVASFSSPIRPYVHSPIRPSNASFQNRSRKPARNVRAHDAGACQQHGARVRRCHSLDDGQVRRYRRVSAQSRGGRHGVDRPRRLPRADSLGRPRGDEGERQLRRAVVDGSRRARGSGGIAHRKAAAH